jgi:hypothetical protein
MNPAPKKGSAVNVLPITLGQDSSQDVASQSRLKRPMIGLLNTLLGWYGMGKSDHG